jgi:hypothetical protein
VTTSAWSLLAATPAPSPGTTSTPDPDLVTPGVAGFLVVFLLAVATILLMRSMTGHLRKVRYSPDPAAEDAEPRTDRPEQQQKPEKPEKPATNGAERP